MQDLLCLCCHQEGALLDTSGFQVPEEGISVEGFESQLNQGIVYHVYGNLFNNLFKQTTPPLTM
jgi:hypothetical protein